MDHDSMLDIPNACHIDHSSTVHDQNRSGVSQNPSGLEVLPSSYDFGRRSFVQLIFFATIDNLIPEEIS